MKLPTDAPRNHTPIIEPTTRAGASFVMELRPTGLRHSSAKVCTRYTITSHIGVTRAPPAANSAAGTRRRKPRPTPTSPIENFTGADGCFAPSLSHSHANIGAKMMMNSAFTDWNQLLGKSNPRNVLRVLRSAKRFSVEPACSNTDQKIAAQMKNTKITHRRPRSCGVQLRSRNSVAKKTTVITRSEYPVKSRTVVGEIEITPASASSAIAT